MYKLPQNYQFLVQKFRHWYLISSGISYVIWCFDQKTMMNIISFRNFEIILVIKDEHLEVLLSVYVRRI